MEAEHKMATQIQLRRDTAANWALINPILAQGEPGLETDTGKVKYGNGINVWNVLPYSVADTVTSIEQLTDVELSSPLVADQVLKYDGTKWVNGAGGTSIVAELDDLTDVNVPSPVSGQALIFNSTTNQWEAQTVLVAEGNLDFGTFTNPTTVNIDLGTF
jgi:hypothetical protein